jgi:hypothetical protein
MEIKGITVKEFLNGNTNAAIIDDENIIWDRKLYAVKGIPYESEGTQCLPIYYESCYDCDGIPNELEKTIAYVCKDGSWFWDNFYIKNENNCETMVNTAYSILIEVINNIYDTILAEPLTKEQEDLYRKEYENGYGFITKDEIIKYGLKIVEKKLQEEISENYIKLRTGNMVIEECLENCDYLTVFANLIAKNEFKKSLAGTESNDVKIRQLFRQKQREGCKTLNVTFRFGDEVVTHKILTNFESYSYVNGTDKATNEFEKKYYRIEMENKDFNGFMPYIESISRGKTILFTQTPAKLLYEIENALVRLVDRYGRYYVRNCEEFLSLLRKSNIHLKMYQHGTLGDFVLDTAFATDRKFAQKIIDILKERKYDFSNLSEWKKKQLQRLVNELNQ